MSGFSALSLKYCCIIGVWCERDSLVANLTRAGQLSSCFAW
ncbi:Uncharacterised protein [Vibrio cholerae]|nr:Uncharacterised protein [Vibrio cholerae]